jgi:hypothetical protein
MNLIPTIEYDSDHRWLVITERLGPNEWGASAIVAENVKRQTGVSIVAALNAARLVSQWHDSIGSGPIEELNAELGELGDLLRAIR